MLPEGENSVTGQWQYQARFNVNDSATAESIRRKAPDTALAQLLEKLDLAGVRLSVDRAGDLRIHGARQLGPELLNTIRSLKSQIVGHLSNTTSSAAHSALPLRGGNGKSKRCDRSQGGLGDHQPEDGQYRSECRKAESKPPPKKPMIEGREHRVQRRSLHRQVPHPHLHPEHHPHKPPSPRP